MTFKTCTRCGIPYDLSCFGRHRSNPDGLQKFCRECRSNADRKSYQKRRNQVIEQVKQRRESLAAWFQNQKAVRSCADCGCQEADQLEVYSSSGYRSMAGAMTVKGCGRARIQKEMDLGAVLCLECHQKRQNLKKTPAILQKPRRRAKGLPFTVTISFPDGQTLRI